jgi:hypothetical protein
MQQPSKTPSDVEKLTLLEPLKSDRNGLLDKEHKA